MDAAMVDETAPKTNAEPGTQHRDPAYFSYYGQLMHQQNMLQDQVRTALYHTVCRQFAARCFRDRCVMDVGAGSGVLSFFACQSGCRRVLAVEASPMADKMRHFIDASIERGVNEFLLPPGKVHILQSKVEDLPASQAVEPHSVDTLISEPIGVLLVHERMLESFLFARDHYLKPGGYIFPTLGSIHLAPFSDAMLWSETSGRARWWQQTDFYGIDFELLMPKAFQELFSMPVVGTFPVHLMLAEAGASKISFDFRHIGVDELKRFTIPIRWTVACTGIMHGIAGWFECDFLAEPYMLRSPQTAAEGGDRTPASIRLSTHPGRPNTHWQQIRFLFQRPLALNSGEKIEGLMRLVVNGHRSYDITAQISIVDPAGVSRSHTCRDGTWYLHEQSYNYSHLQQQQPNVAVDALQEWSGIYRDMDHCQPNIPST